MKAPEFFHKKDITYMNRLSTSLDFDRIVSLMEEYAALRIHAVSGWLGFDEGYKQGYNDATREACQDIAENYQPKDN